MKQIEKFSRVLSVNDRAYLGVSMSRPGYQIYVIIIVTAAMAKRLGD